MCCLLWAFLWIIVILSIIIWILSRYLQKPVIIEINANKCEPFTIPAKKVNGAVLFAIYKPDENDYQFVERWSNIIPFYIVNNGDHNEWSQKIQKLPNVKFMTRENKGHDIAAWAAGMEKWNDELSKYDVVCFVNNSCIYYMDLCKLMGNAMDYDIYGLTQNKGGSRFTLHLQTTFLIINKRLYNSDFFKDHWKNLRKDKGHLYATLKHEWEFTKKAIECGFKLGVYDMINGYTLYEEGGENEEYKREFVKKYAECIFGRKPRDAAGILNKNIENNRSKGYAVINLTNTEQ